MSNNKKFVIEASFIKEAYNLKLDLGEFLLLLYFENADDLTFDVDVISKKLKMPKENILEAFNSLLSKKIINLESVKNEAGKRYDKVSLEGFYKQVEADNKKETKENLKDDIFTKFETEFRRPLTGMEFELIKAWIEKLYSEELILKALEEAVYNGATSIRYIDTILYEWHKKGFKTKEDVDNYYKNRYENKKLEETNLLEWNWLDDDK